MRQGVAHEETDIILLEWVEGTQVHRVPRTETTLSRVVGGSVRDRVDDWLTMGVPDLAGRSRLWLLVCKTGQEDAAICQGCSGKRPWASAAFGACQSTRPHRPHAWRSGQLACGYLTAIDSVEAHCSTAPTRCVRWCPTSDYRGVMDNGYRGRSATMLRGICRGSQTADGDSLALGGYARSSVRW